MTHSDSEQNNINHSPPLSETFRLTVSDPANWPALLAEVSGLSQTRLKSAMAKGAVWCKRGQSTNRIRRVNANVKAGDEILFHYFPDALNDEPLQPELIANEATFSVWLKPRGMTVSGSRFADHTSLKRWVEVNQRSGNTVFIVHRLDRFTAGLIVVAHNKSTAADLSRQFRERTVKKCYHAICTGNWTSVWGNAQTITTPIEGKPAVTHVKKLDGNDEFSLLEIRIDTGRKHQIRQHLAEIGYPVVGDRQYGEKDTTADLQLVATGLTFTSPDGEELGFELAEDKWPRLPTEPSKSPDT